MTRLFERNPGPQPLDRPLDWPDARAGLIRKLSERLGPLGLHYKTAMDFFEEESDDEGLRRTFRIHDPGMGRPLTAHWGYGLDFVPHLVGGRIGWHRTFATARRDLWIVSRDGKPEAHRALGREVYISSIYRVIDDGVAQAQAFWAATRSLEAVTGVLLRASWQLRAAPGSESHIARRSPLSLPFALERLGAPGGEALLEETLRAIQLSPGTVARVRDAFDMI